MSASSDWPAVDNNNVCLPTIVASTDLFDGELFGDELLDIYNSAVVDGQLHGHVVDAHDIPHLLEGHDSKGDLNHPGVHVAHVAAAIDDGLGAFRPSTSFNDLTTLLTPSGEPVVAAPGVGIQRAQVSLPSSPGANPKSTKKRKGAAAASGDSPTKKRGGGSGTVGAGGARGGRRPSLKKQSLPAGSPLSAAIALPTGASAASARPAKTPSKAKAGAPKEDDTPNPLDLENATGSSKVGPKITPKLTVHVQVSAPVARATLPLLPVSPDNRGSTSDDEEPDEEFMKMAQAAVSSLIASAGKDGTSAAYSASSANEKVDTSTEHIKALTGNNWVQACSAGPETEPPEPPTMSDPKSAGAAAAANSRVRRQNLTADERARQNRDRNREHARNTRLRKKAYVEELKRTLVELVSQRDANDLEKRQSVQREAEQREVRFRVIEEFLKIRGRNEANPTRWSAILEEGFTFTVPVTPFRKMVATGQEGLAEQVLRGVGDCMADATFFAGFLQGLGSQEATDTVTFQYHVDRKDFFMDGCTGLLDWEGTTIGAVKRGAPFELKVKGTIRGEFSPASNKLVSAILTFDSGRVATQVRALIGGSNDDTVAIAAARAAASQADAFLDSLQMPLVSVPSAVVVPSSSSASDTSSDKGEVSCDDSVSEANDFHSSSATASQAIARRSG